MNATSLGLLRLGGSDHGAFWRIEHGAEARVVGAPGLLCALLVFELREPVRAGATVARASATTL